MNRDCWRRGFDELPRWTCPHCRQGLIHPLNGYPHVEETEYSKREQKQADSEPDWTMERFVALLKCDVPDCGEVVSFGGNRIAALFQDYQARAQHWESVLVPLFVRPAPHIIHVSKNLPAPVAYSFERRSNSIGWIKERAQTDFGFCRAPDGPFRGASLQT